MTNEEALKNIRKLSELYTLFDGDIFSATCDMAIKALEKQIPKKPAMWGDGYADGELVMESYECPHCGRIYDFDTDGELKFCCECGQAIDWTEEGAD